MNHTHVHYKGHKNLAEMVSTHLAALRAGLTEKRDAARDTLDSDDESYWEKELSALDDITRAVAIDLQPLPMASAPMDGTRILVQTEVHHYGPLYRRPNSLKGWKSVGTRWVEARFYEDRWQEWCGTAATICTGTLHPMHWRPVPC